MPQRGVLEVAMKVLWLCNVVLPVAARQLGMEVSNKEGWVSGMAQELLERRQENDIALILAFPVPKAMVPEGEEIFCREIQVEMPPREERESGQEGAGQAEADSGQKNAAERKASSGKVSLACCGFPEDVRCPEKYDGSLEPALKKIVDIVRPDIVHCFGTEYPHTLAMCRVFPRKDRILVGLQGLCVLYAQAYYADLPERVIRSVTLRDFLRKDNLRQQRQKFVLRGEMEREAIGMAGNVTGRTEWDKSYALEWNPKARYHAMNETLRREFYGPVWDRDRCVPHSIFLSQGDYPLKGLHYMLLALPKILARYPDAKVSVAGNSLVEYRTLKQKLKISAYGRYLRSLVRGLGLEGHVAFLGKLTAGQMRDRYLASSLYVCCSALENSPNSLGEAMLLGMPCVSADVGGIPSMFTDGVDGILYRGFSERGAGRHPADGGLEREASKAAESGGFGGRDGGGMASGPADEGELEAVSGRLADAVLKMWDNPQKWDEYCANARRHALETHDRKRNYEKLVEIYGKIL